MKNLLKTAAYSSKAQAALALLVLTVACIPALVLAAKEPPPEVVPLVRDPDALMSEEIRAAVKRIVVLPGASLEDNSISGSYQEATLNGGGPISVGGPPQVVRDIYGIPVGLSFPIFSISSGGGGSGGVSRKEQEFRDALTKELVKAADSPLSSDALATDVFWRLREVPALEPKIFATNIPIPEDTDAILFVRFSDSMIDVQGEFAFLTMSAIATLTRKSDAAVLYEHMVHYRDRDTLENWTKNNNEAWYDFSAFSRHYLAREIAAELYERVNVQTELRPRQTATALPVKDDVWNTVSNSSTPTFAWDFNLTDDELQPEWAKDLDVTDVTYEFEIYDKHRIVYGARDLRESQYTIDMELEACKAYRWSVRPSFRVNGEQRYGEWMRSDPDSANGNDGKAASFAPAYIYDFASLEIKCGNRRG
ncbi:MAG: hypothetical protein OEY82_13720 [Gammaproteobacteria bacterium]|nr:hypothetical protein [Gammaproteobacteria bacterium]MDH5262493.1 hypothetical protein [Gammaproteobacteria bacterium]MDH5584919.1 hypothetical protein [Gammaproteobacteria bacterium]